ncbi:uncharacterized abhydrolase domain-containing protein DDB_G0269086-like [Branchiostoma lanceolatum]|uniref:uncharacterized abhydrolase domain-containing protein DDB_G0269086-like n=1 Tax=Branchiostoma lanceolatum TaxID=7740 RepID=UPI00345130C6
MPYEDKIKRKRKNRSKSRRLGGVAAVADREKNLLAAATKDLQVEVDRLRNEKAAAMAALEEAQRVKATAEEETRVIREEKAAALEEAQRVKATAEEETRVIREEKAAALKREQWAKAKIDFLHREKTTAQEEMRVIREEKAAALKEAQWAKAKLDILHREKTTAQEEAWAMQKELSGHPQPKLPRIERDRLGDSNGVPKVLGSGCYGRALLKTFADYFKPTGNLERKKEQTL